MFSSKKALFHVSDVEERGFHESVLHSRAVLLGFPDFVRRFLAGFFWKKYIKDYFENDEQLRSTFASITRTQCLQLQRQA